VLWLCLLATRLPLEAIATTGTADLAVVARHGNRRWVVDSTTDCAPGTGLSAALAVHALTVVERNPGAERAALEQLAWFAYSIGAPVHLLCEEPQLDGQAPLHAVWVEVSTSLALRGGLASLRAHVRDAIARQSLTIVPGLAPTLEGALLAARAGIVLETPHRLRSWLQRQPLDVLRLPQQALAVCRGSGIRTAGALLALPPASLARRFGAAVPDYLRRLTGESPDPRPALVPPSTFRRRFELLGVVDNAEMLLIPLRRLLVELEHYLRARDVGVLRFTIELVHENHRRSRHPVGLASAVRDANHFLLIARERLARTGLAAGVTELIVRADDFVEADTTQRDLFDGSARQQQQWNTVIEKIAARWGDTAAWNPGLVADHRPERAWRRLAPGSDGDTCTFPDRPLWLLASPQPIARPEDLVGMPERIAAGWWHDAIDRLYYTARAPDGTRLWVFHDRQTQRWHLHGLWA